MTFDVTSRSFGLLGSYPKRYYEAAIETGRILISGKRVNCQYKVQGGDELTHIVHRHEPAVGLSECSSESTNPSDHQPINIIYEDESILVVDKPSTLPIHPCGAYHYNSLFEILSHWKPQEYGPGKLFTIYRLDRLTSGIVLLAKNATLAKSLSKCIHEREGCEKLYFARVKGRFPFNILQRNNACDDGKIGSKDSWEFQYDSSNISGNFAPPCIHGNISNTSMKQWKGGVQVPLNAKEPFNTRHDTTNKKDQVYESLAALGYWFTDIKGDIATHASLEDIFKQSVALTPEEILALATNEPTNTTNDSNQTGGSTSSSILWLNFACPCRVLSHKDGVCEAGDFSHLTEESERNGIKPAQTSFTLLSYDESSDTSVVLAKPVTGRTHQIRLHLQQLMHPIANDHCYGGTLWYDDDASSAACDISKKLLDDLDCGADCSDQTQCTTSIPSHSTLSDDPATDKEIYHVVANRPREKNEAIVEFIEKTCVWCARCKGVTKLSEDINNISSEDRKKQTETSVIRRTIMEYFVRSQGIWLHAFRYSLKTKETDRKQNFMSYQTQFPSWSCIC
jgi:23S rRNA-/tRNA-specific pseudouridylate synthase